jgi:hypothetical protein
LAHHSIYQKIVDGGEELGMIEAGLKAGELDTRHKSVVPLTKFDILNFVGQVNYIQHQLELLLQQMSKPESSRWSCIPTKPCPSERPDQSHQNPYNDHPAPEFNGNVFIDPLSPRLVDFRSFFKTVMYDVCDSLIGRRCVIADRHFPFANLLAMFTPILRLCRQENNVPEVISAYHVEHREHKAKSK